MSSARLEWNGGGSSRPPSLAQAENHFPYAGILQRYSAGSLCLGAVAYVLKGNAARDLPVALETVLEGKKFASRGVDRDALSRPEVA